MMREVTIDTKDWDDLRAAQKIRDALVDREGPPRWISSMDVVALTGLPKQLAEQGLKCLAGLAHADVRVEKTQVEFRFRDLDSVPRWFGLPGWAQSLRAGMMKWWVRFWNWATQPVVGLLTLTFAITLYVGWLQAGWGLARDMGGIVGIAFPVLSLPFFVLAVIALVVAFPLYIVLSVVLSCGYQLIWGWLLAPMVGATPPDVGPTTGGEALQFLFGAGLCGGIFGAILFAVRKKYLALIRPVAKRIEPLWTTGQVRRDDLWDERQFVALVAENNGVVGLGDVMKMYGWTRDQAFEEMTRLVVDYGGDIRVDQHGTITFHYEELAREIDLFTTKTTRPIWEITNSPRDAFAAENNPMAESVAYVLLLVPTIPWVVAFATGVDIRGFFVAAEDTSWLVISSVAGIATMVLTVGYLVGRRVLVMWRERRWQQRKPFVQWLKRFAIADGQLRLNPEQVDETILQQLDGRIQPDDIDEQGRVLVEVPVLSSTEERRQPEKIV